MDAIASDRSDAIESIIPSGRPDVRYLPTNSVLTHIGNYQEMLSHLTSICKIFELQQDSRTVGRKALEFSLLKRVLAAFTNIFCIVVLIRSMLLIKLLTYRYRSDIDQPISFEATC